MAGYDPNNSFANPYGTSKGGPERVTDLGNGTYADPTGGFWTGTWENPTRMSNPALSTQNSDGSYSRQFTDYGDGSGKGTPAGSNYGAPTASPAGNYGAPSGGGYGTSIPLPRGPAAPVSDGNGGYSLTSYSGIGGGGSQQGGYSGSSEGRDFIEEMLRTKFANNPNGAAQAYNQRYGATTGNEAYYDPQRNIVVTPFSGYFAGGSGGWQWAQTHPEGPGGGGGGQQQPTSYTWDQALQQVNQAAGRQLSPDEINQLLSKYGGTAGGSVSSAGLAPVLAGLRGTNMGGNGGTRFGDPSYDQLAQMVQERLRNLSQPVNFPGLQDYMSQLSGAQGAARYRALNFAQDLQQRIGQLQRPLMTDQDVANQNALARNGLLSQRDTALANSREQLSARGFDPTTSGLAEGSSRAIQDRFSNQDASVQAQLMRSMFATDEARRNQATQLQGLATQALQGGDTNALQYAATLSDLENQMFNMNENRQRESLTTANIPVELTNQGFANAHNVANSGGDPMSSIMQLLQMGNQQQGLMQGNSNSNWQALAFLLQQLGS